MNKLEQKLQDQIDIIEQAIVKTRQNDLVDISAMDKEVAEICQKIINGEEETAKALEAKMIEMINKLDDLAVELKEYQDRMNPGDD